MRKKAALVLGMAITFSQVAMAEEITSSTEQIENCTPETSVQEENFQETEQQSNVNEVQESVSEDEEVQMQESTIESSEVESEIASELDNTVEESTSELDTTSASEVDNDLLQKMYEYAQIYKVIVRQIDIQRIILIVAPWLKDASMNWELPMCLIQPQVGIVH